LIIQRESAKSGKISTKRALSKIAIAQHQDQFIFPISFNRTSALEALGGSPLSLAMLLHWPNASGQRRLVPAAPSPLQHKGGTLTALLLPAGGYQQEGARRERYQQRWGREQQTKTICRLEVQGSMQDFNRQLGRRTSVI